MTTNERPWSQIIRWYVYELIILVVMLGLIAVGYLSWQRSSSDESQRLANGYHLASVSRYLKAMVELRHVVSHMLLNQAKADANSGRRITSLEPEHEYNRAVSYYLIGQEVRYGLELQRIFADGRFDSLSVRLERQLNSFEDSTRDYFLKSAGVNGVMPALRRLMLPTNQLVRLHTVVRDDLLIEMKARESRQMLVILVLVSGLLLIGFLITKRGLRAIDAVIAVQQGSEHNLREVNRRMALAADSAGFGVWDVDLIKNELVWDRWMFRLFGVEPNGFKGTYEEWERCIHPDDLERIRGEVDRTIRGERDSDMEYRIVQPGGAVRSILASAVVMRDSDGAPARMTGVNFDITERKQAQAELEKRVEELTQARKVTQRMMVDVETARQDAEQASRVKSEFLANMSHEICTPLNAVTGISYLLSQTCLTNKQAEYIDTIHRSMTHVTGIIDDLLDFAKPGAGKPELERLPFDLDQ
ncbi:MAG: PAS domain-containing protein, partial [Gammaproteobacteria bacterium]|nr:PAS domain-containing protein [Gammaproteobacteria bacterium]